MSDNSRILELPPVTANASGDVFPLVQDGVTKKTTLSKIKTFFDAIYTTPSAVASQISSALTNYVTNSSLATTLSEYVTLFDLSNILGDYALKTLVETKQDRQTDTIENINANIVSVITLPNCILSITNIPSGTGNKSIIIDVTNVLTVSDFLQLTVKYGGFDVNLRSYNITLNPVLNKVFLTLYINVHSSPTEPVIISMNKIN